MMRSSMAAVSVATIFAVSPANAQSLSDAINAALAADSGGNNCAALGAGVGQVTDQWQFDDLSGLIEFRSPTPASPATTIAPPLDVPDGTGRTYIVRASDVVTLDPAVANAMSEAELFAFLRQTGVQFVQQTRFAAGSFGSGLSGLCQSVTARVNQNGNVGASGGFAGGSSSASGRSVSSLSSAREQSSKSKKRKRKRDERNSSYEDGYVRLASADGGVGLVADAAGVGPFGVQTFIDIRGGYTDLERDATALESGFDGRTLWGQGSLTAEFADNLAIAGSFSYQRSKGEFDATNASGGANEFRERNITGGLFLLASLPLGVTSLDLAAGGFYGGGEGSIERTFTTSRQVTYMIDVTDPVMTVDTLTLIRSQAISDDLAGEFDTRNHGFSAAASMSFDMGAFILTPGVEFTHFSFRQNAYEEAATDGFNNGLALSYSEFKDKWTETRIGGALSRSFGLLRLEGYGDLVLTGGAATPTRTATFAEDLRASPFVLSYEVDDLDKSFGVFGLVAAASLADGVEAFVGGETTAGHDYLRARTIFAGVRITP